MSGAEIGHGSTADGPIPVGGAYALAIPESEAETS